MVHFSSQYPLKGSSRHDPFVKFQIGKEIWIMEADEDGVKTSVFHTGFRIWRDVKVEVPESLSEGSSFGCKPLKTITYNGKVYMWNTRFMVIPDSVFSLFLTEFNPETLEFKDLQVFDESDNYEFSSLVLENCIYSIGFGRFDRKCVLRTFYLEKRISEKFELGEIKKGQLHLFVYKKTVYCIHNESAEPKKLYVLENNRLRLITSVEYQYDWSNSLYFTFKNRTYIFHHESTDECILFVLNMDTLEWEDHHTMANTDYLPFRIIGIFEGCGRVYGFWKNDKDHRGMIMLEIESTLESLCMLKLVDHFAQTANVCLVEEFKSQVPEFIGIAFDEMLEWKKQQNMNQELNQDDFYYGCSADREGEFTESEMSMDGISRDLRDDLSMDGLSINYEL